MKLIPEEIRIQQINALPNISFIRWGGEYRGAKSKAVCRCLVDGFEWAAVVDGLLNGGTGCPQCTNDFLSNKYRISEDDRIQQINAMPNLKFLRWENGYKNSYSKAICKCAVDGFEWTASVNDLCNKGAGCPQCSGKRRWTAEERIAQVNAKLNISFVRWAGSRHTSKSKAVCLCQMCGFEWAAPIGHLVSNGTGCPKCAGNLAVSAEERMAQINSRPNISFVGWVGVYRGAESKAICKCAVDGFEWTASVKDLCNKGTGCPQCAGQIATPPNERISQINARPDISFVRWDGSYKNSRSKAVVKCAADGFEWTASITALVNHKTGCPQCADKGYNPAKAGTLYILRSECGAMVKIGISNDYKRRHTELRNVTPFNWSCIEMLHNEDGSLIAELEKELHSWTEQAAFKATFQGYTEWRKWDDRLPRWVERYRARLARIAAGVAP